LDANPEPLGVSLGGSPDGRVSDRARVSPQGSERKD
jgi:hypothetical protein